MNNLRFEEKSWIKQILLVSKSWTEVFERIFTYKYD